MDLADLESKLSENTSSVYFENPSFLGFIEAGGPEISKKAHDVGAISIVGVDPSSLGILQTPGKYGADIVCGDLQPLGIHMNYGGGQSGFISTRDEEKYVMEYPSRLFGIAPTIVEGEYGFGDVAYERTSFAHREGGKEYVGTQTALWGITAGVYLSLMGPKGMEELGQTIMQKSQYAAKELSSINNVEGSLFTSAFFKEFVVDFNKTGKTVKEINSELLKRGIFGGLDLSNKFPSFGQTALYCITEIHSKCDIDKLVSAIKEIVKE
jgi:glycine dehydrogenase subunit 1